MSLAYVFIIEMIKNKGKKNLYDLLRAIHVSRTSIPFLSYVE